ncbi:DEAD/DEAH box helicase [candidate division GN15 bacterium]|nr:DEAD/DEAH box helicase [candidate division GN15 bacterium]
MQLRDLEREGIPARVVELWRADQGESLLPVQDRALRAGLLAEGVRSGTSNASGPRHLLIMAPTSSGKSFCAEMAAMKALAHRQRVVWLVPLKSLAEEVSRTLRRRYQPLGIEVIVVTGDHPENDRAFRQGAFQLAVVIYEKLDLLLTAEMDRLCGIGLVVVDELQMIAEPGRGPILERLLLKLLRGAYRPRLLTLSASLGDTAARELAGWLGAELVQENHRPVDLYRGVAADGSYRYRSFNSGADGCEPFYELESGDDRLDAFLARLQDSEGSTLVFLKSRQDTLNLAFRLAAQVNWPSAALALQSLESAERSFLTRTLMQTLRRGVAFHNADLTPEQRRVVEKAFYNKEVRVVFSTTTLAMGVNLPADTVYLETVKYVSGAYDGRPGLVPISRAEFDNMTGRAGRLGLVDGRIGRAIILADSEFDRDVLWETYIAPVDSSLPGSSLGETPVTDFALNFIACGLADSATDLMGLFEGSLYGRLGGAAPDFAAALSELVTVGLIAETGGAGRWSVTPLGRAVAASGLSVVDACAYLRYLADGYPQSDFGWTALALTGQGWHRPPGLLTRAEQAGQAPLRMLYQRDDHAVVEAAWLLPTEPRQPLSYQQALAVKALLLLDEWARLVPAARLEERFQVHLGQIRSLAESVGHLLTALAGLVEATDQGSPAIGKLRDRAFSIRHGLPVSLRSLHEAFDCRLNRSELTALRGLGVERPNELRTLSSEDGERVTTSKSKLLMINEKIQSAKEEVEMKSVTVDVDPTVVGEPEIVEIDGSQERERFVVRINGCPVRLTGKSFKYFAKLAWSRRHAESGWMYKEDIEAGFNQARYLYRMKNEVNAGLGSDWPVVENNRLGYYRLDVDPSKIRFNRRNLKDHPDWEVRSLFEAVPEQTGAAGSDLVS